MRGIREERIMILANLTRFLSTCQPLFRSDGTQKAKVVPKHIMRATPMTATVPYRAAIQPAKRRAGIFATDFKKPTWESSVARRKDGICSFNGAEKKGSRIPVPMRASQAPKVVSHSHGLTTQSPRPTRATTTVPLAIEGKEKRRTKRWSCV